jgi:hypothetical protein
LYVIHAALLQQAYAWLLSSRPTLTSTAPSIDAASGVWATKKPDAYFDTLWRRSESPTPPKTGDLKLSE